MEYTLLTCTPDMESPLFKRHLRAIKNCQGSFEHIVIDNNRGAGFNHAREINRGIKIARHRYLVTLDDDLIVRENWLDGLGNGVKTGASVVGGIQRYEDGTINHSGGYVLPSGRTGHDIEEIETASYYPYLCSAVMLIDREFCIENELFFDENFRKYYQEVDFCLRVWEAEGSVLSTPECDVYHLIGQAMKETKVLSESIDQIDLKYFKDKWVKTGRLKDILEKKGRIFRFGGWEAVSEVQNLIELYNTASETRDYDLFTEVIEGADNLGNISNKKQLLSGSWFHKGVIFRESGKLLDAKESFENCLLYNPHHNKAAEFLKEMGNV